MHPKSRDTCDWLPWEVGRETEKPVCVVSESYRGGLLKLLHTGLAWLQPIVTKVENENKTAKLSPFIHRLDG